MTSSRWLRLIFTRELPFGTALRIWDGVVAEDPGLGLLDFICVAMLLDGKFMRTGTFEEVFNTNDERVKTFYNYNFIQ
ncbi:MAG: hypothetical protein EOO61_13400 [Hymenobacter sp.]|nr:MAG: hypothetical protein EOO61_13400 [Hymenobacter sp.]